MLQERTIDSVSDTRAGRWSWALRSLTSGFLVLWLGAILIPLAFFVGGALWSWRVVEADARAAIERTTDMLHEHALRSIETQEAILAATDQRIAGADWNRIRSSTSIAQFLQKLSESVSPIGGIAIVDPSGVMAAASFELPASPIVVSDRDYFKAAQAPGSDIYIGKVLISRPAQKHVFPVARKRTSPDGSFDGLIVSSFQTKYFDDFYESLARDPDDLIALVRKDGYVLARAPRMQEDINLRITSNLAARNGALRASDGAEETISPIDGRYRFAATRQVGTYPLFVRHGRSVASIRRQWARGLVPYGTFCLAAMGLLCLLTWRTSAATRREQEARAKLLTEEARRAADAENASRIARLMEANVFGVVNFSSAGILQANDAFLRIVGLDRELFRERGFDWRGALSKVDYARHELAQSELTQTGACQPYEIEILRPDGKTVPVLIGATLYERDPLIWISFVLDLSERREREAQQLFVMRELNHRTKNLLTVIRSIAGQIARTGRDWSDFKDRFTDRLSALGDSHDLLVESNWNGVSMNALIESQFRQFEDLTGGQIATTGESLMLSPRAAQAIGMALYELSTNAVKYGALAATEGRIEIDWSIRREQGVEDMFVMHWRESGGPRVQEPDRQGFGHIVIEQMTARALRGSVVYTFAKDGVQWTLEAPLESIEERPDTPFMAKL